jgi:hypothetical protein
MARGDSGRIVLEVDRELKERLYQALHQEGLTLKDWFVREARAYLASGPQLSLGFDNSPVARKAQSQ